MDENSINAIKELGETAAETPRGEIHCICIIGQVEGQQTLPEEQKTTKYEHLMPLLASLEETKSVGGVLFLLNTVGGDVDAGLGIAELIAGMTKPTASLVIGGGHSIGVPLAVAARKSFIAPSAAVTLHPVRMTGTVIGAPRTYRYLESIQERIVGFICRNSNISRERLLDYMLCADQLANDMGTVISGGEAVECGLIDSLGSLSDALDFLHREIDKK